MHVSYNEWILATKMNCKPQFSNLFSKHIFTRTPTGKFHKQRVYLFHSLQSVDLSNFLKSHEGDKNVLRKKKSYGTLTQGMNYPGISAHTK